MKKKKGGCAKKKVVKKVWGMRQNNSQGAANLRSAPGGRHPSYATALDPHTAQPLTSSIHPY